LLHGGGGSIAFSAVEWLQEYWLDAVGWIGSALLVFSVMQARVLRFRVLNLAACLILTGFNAALDIWPMVAMNVALSAINIWFIVRLVRDRHSEAAFKVLRVAPDDAYLHHFLGVHGPDIARFHPSYDATSADDLVWLVLRGDETVGVVVIRREGDVARVQLDYVTPRFRDFSPGEFVWRQATDLRERGFRRIVTPPDMVGAYYDRLDAGFRREGASYVLEL
jgi:hypothetical protein